VVDHRASGQSEGHVITFGVNESRDCQTWVNYILENIDANATIILAGISMGAATVMTVAGGETPKNVVGVLADCGYTSTKDIVKKVMREMKLPASLVYPFARFSAIVLGGFDPDADSPIKAMSRCRLPIIFIHGDADDFVPFSMSEQNFAACTSENKRLVKIAGAGHGLAFPVDNDGYIKELEEFFRPYL
jgi:fermentation-respiration switch protein FrsA (DUF1100 family)